MNTKLSKIDASAVQAIDVPLPSPSLSIEQVFQAVIEKNVSPENITVMRELLAMAAEQKFTAAFVALQADLPVIVAKTAIQNRGKYEKFEDVMSVVSPLLTKHGFTVSFSMDVKENRILETCHLKHAGGHSQSNSFAVRTRKADSDTQADCMAATTAKRNALCNALNIVIRQDVLNEENDPAIEGDPNALVTTDQADELERRCKELNSNVTMFLKMAGATKFSEIPARNYDVLDRMLAEKARRPS